MMVSTATQTAANTPADTALDRLVSSTQGDMEKVNELILSRADSHVDMVPELARYLIDSGGKRLRPMLTLAAARLFSADPGSEIKFAAAVEFMHNATLLHDDVVDESNMRRGKPAARMVWGNQASVLVGDFLLGQAFLMMVETRNLGALEVLSRAAAVIAEGEVFQLAKTGDIATTPDEYDQVIRAKTATLFAAATEVGSMAGGASDTERDAMRIYGLELGRAFQLVDDVLDYGGSSGVLGKNAGDDLREGKMTLPVILALGKATPVERELISSALGNVDAETETFTKVLSILNKYQTLEETVQTATGYAATAQSALSELPDTPMRSLLAEVAQFCVERAY